MMSPDSWKDEIWDFIVITIVLIFLAVITGCTHEETVPSSTQKPFECPEDMAKVVISTIPKSKLEAISHTIKDVAGEAEKAICVDRWEYPNSKGIKPEGFKNRQGCVEACRGMNKRLLSKSEWQMACSGTPVSRCNTHSEHPIVSILQKSQAWVEKGVNCKADPWSFVCMNSSQLVGPWLWENSENECVSSSGVYNMVGNLGEWISDTLPNGHGVFMGGLAPQPKSSCDYETRAHNFDWSDYSTGCRCGRDL